MGMHGRVKLDDGFAYSKSGITREGFSYVFEHLVEDLLEIWSDVHAYDGLSSKMFNLHNAILWCIHDYPV
jgi:hypothetical protein